MTDLYKKYQIVLTMDNRHLIRKTDEEGNELFLFDMGDWISVWAEAEGDRCSREFGLNVMSFDHDEARAARNYVVHEDGTHQSRVRGPYYDVEIDWEDCSKFIPDFKVYKVSFENRRFVKRWLKSDETTGWHATWVARTEAKTYEDENHARCSMNLAISEDGRKGET